MADSLDLLLTRQPSAGRRAAPVQPMQSPTRQTAPFSPTKQQQQQMSYEQRYTSSYDSKPSVVSPVVKPLYSKDPLSSPSTTSSSLYAETKLPSYDSQTRSYESGIQSASQTPLGASLASNLTSKLQSSSQPVNWSAFKAKRAGSASAVQSVPTTVTTPQQPFVPTGPKSAAAGLSGEFVKASSKTFEGKENHSDSTVIDGSVIFPVRQQVAPLSTPVKSSLAPLSSPVKPLSSPFATATSTGRPALGDPESAVRTVQTFSCPDCRRNFKRGSLMKHQKVCKKVFLSKRGQFDSAKARTQDLGLEELPAYQDANEEEEDAAESGIRPVTAAAGMRKGAKEEETKEQDSSSSGASSGKVEKTWKDQSDSLREAMRRAKQQKKFAQSSAAGIDMRAMMPKNAR